ncbi:Pe-pgrs family protein [Mycobacterium tuberculosis variant bovis BCG str. ATCC 35743]|nr:Pe-pgrs family protein [Mycobacterium tuberculosis variant bovis BCG str. ATCC 35743]
MTPLLNSINAPVLAATGRPLIGNGANGAPGTGANGGDASDLSGLGREFDDEFVNTDLAAHTDQA